MAKKPITPPPAVVTVKFGDNHLPLVDPRRIQPISVDLITEAREFNGIIALSFGTLSIDGNSSPEASVSCRIRMSMAGAADLRATLDSLLSRVTQPKVTAH